MPFPRMKILPLAVALLGAAACAKSNAVSPTGSGGTSPTGTGGTGGDGNPNAAKALHVEGNRLVDTTGATVRLLGVNRAGTEYMCSTATVKSTFDGPTGDDTLDAMVAWHANTLRLPINESCWLALPGTTAAANGELYQTYIQDYVDRAHAKGLYVIIDLHWTSNGTTVATRQTTMADADHAVAFWQSAATFFQNDPMVLFDLYNEPILDDTNNNPAQGDPWNCWLSGCVTQQGWQTAGMQQMVNAVRDTGATQVIIANGINWASKLDSWLAHKPSDPTGNLMAGIHVYNNTSCSSAACWNGPPASVAAQVPLVTGELGERDCATAFINSYMSWADSHGVGYIGWAFNPQNCAMFPALIADWPTFTPTTYGAGLRAHLMQVN